LIRIPSPLPAPMQKTRLFLSCDGFARNKFSAFVEVRPFFYMVQPEIFNRWVFKSEIVKDEDLNPSPFFPFPGSDSRKGKNG
jgi:hypothetical protein